MVRHNHRSEKKKDQKYQILRCGDLVNFHCIPFCSQSNWQQFIYQQFTKHTTILLNIYIRGSSLLYWQWVLELTPKHYDPFQIHQSIIWSQASIKEIRPEENLISCTKQLTSSISHICFHLVSGNLKVQNLEYKIFNILNISFFFVLNFIILILFISVFNVVSDFYTPLYISGERAVNVESNVYS